MAAYGDYQNEIYFAGLRGEMPKLPVDFASLYERARQAMSPVMLNYVDGGCGNEHTQRWNVTAFDHWGLMPRMLRACAIPDQSIDLFGLRLPSPIFMAPIGVIGLCSQDGHGDLAVARASAISGVPMMGSTLMNDPLETVLDACGETPAFFQLYTPKDNDVAASLVQRAEKAGAKAIAVTLDTWVTGWRPRDLNTSSFPQLRGKVLENYFTDPAFRKLLAKPPEGDRVAATMKWAELFGRPLTWDDLPWLRSLTKLPMILKGICDPDDARRAIDAGFDAIYCSNHGGRQANGGLATIDLLPDIVAAVGKTPVLFDSGVRSGTDVVKALALGATAVGIGRPYAFGLALGGTEGVVHVLRSILAEADLLMAINGYPTRGDLEASAIRRV